MGQTSEGVPAVLIRGLGYQRSEDGVKDYCIGVSRISLTTGLKMALVRIAYKLLRKPGKQ